MLYIQPNFSPLSNFMEMRWGWRCSQGEWRRENLDHLHHPAPPPLPGELCRVQIEICLNPSLTAGWLLLQVCCCSILITTSSDQSRTVKLLRLTEIVGRGPPGPDRIDAGSLGRSWRLKALLCFHLIIIIIIFLHLHFSPSTRNRHNLTSSRSPPHVSRWDLEYKDKFSSL